MRKKKQKHIIYLKVIKRKKIEEESKEIVKYFLFFCIYCNILTGGDTDEKFNNFTSRYIFCNKQNNY